MGVTVKDRSKKGGDNFMDIKIKFIDNYKKIKAVSDNLSLCINNIIFTYYNCICYHNEALMQCVDYF